ncbi:MAG TPA: ABC transporter permease [Gemmatimonadales bacterium]
MTIANWVLVLILAVLSALVVRRLERRPEEGWRRFFNYPGSGIGLGALIFVIALAVLAPLIAPYRPSLQLDIVALQNRPPSWAHILGTDLFARDLWSRIVYGARISLGVGALAALVTVVIGAAAGAAAGYFGAATESVLMRLVDIGLAIPRIFMVLIVIAVGRQLGATGLALLLGLTGWFATARLVRADVLVLREESFIEAARALGARPWRVIARHLLPNAAATLIVSAALAVANMMLLEAGLSFLGVGVQPPTPSWGNMIADARDQLTAAPWSSIFPGLALTVVVMALHAVADGARDALDPRQGQAAG